MDSLNIIVTLLLIMDPIGNISLFAVIIDKIHPKRRMKILIRELLAALALILFFFFLGKYLLTMLNLQQESLKIAGGIILFLISLEMVFQKTKSINVDDIEGEPFIVPMATPLIAGPSLFATIVIFSTTYNEHYWQLLGAIIIAWAVNSFFLLSSPIIGKLFKRKGMLVMEKLMGMILIAFAVQMLLSGIKAFFNI